MMPLLFLSKVLNALFSNNKVIGILTGSTLWLTGLIDRFMAWMFEKFLIFVATINFQEFNGIDLSVVYWIGVINAIIPLDEFIHLYGIYLSVVVSLIAFRWAKSFVPTVSN